MRGENKCFGQAVLENASLSRDRFECALLGKTNPKIAQNLTAPEWAEIARLAIAPFRLGLPATYDPRQAEPLNEFLGPLAWVMKLRKQKKAKRAKNATGSNLLHFLPSLLFFASTLRSGGRTDFVKAPRHQAIFVQ
jgi:hypothetical protein